jgi:hypothetical protein
MGVSLASHTRLASWHDRWPHPASDLSQRWEAKSNRLGIYHTIGANNMITGLYTPLGVPLRSSSPLLSVYHHSLLSMGSKEQPARDIPYHRARQYGNWPFYVFRLYKWPYVRLVCCSLLTIVRYPLSMGSNYSVTLEIATSPKSNPIEGCLCGFRLPCGLTRLLHSSNLLSHRWEGLRNA